MKKNDKAKREQKPQGRVPKVPKHVTELTDQELEQVQGGGGSFSFGATNPLVQK